MKTASPNSLPGEVLKFRRARPDEAALVRSSWFESYRKGGCAPEVPFPTYKTGQNEIMDRLLGRGQVWVATLTEVPDEVLGWVCFDETAIHYVYVKQAYRRRGIATSLIALAGARVFTHQTRAWRPLATRFRLQFNPYLLNP